MSPDFINDTNQEANPKWLNAVYCFVCRKNFFGTPEDLLTASRTNCNSGKNEHQFSNMYLAVSPGRCVCLSCSRWYKLVKGGENTVNQCDSCARSGKQIPAIKMGSPRTMRCDGYFTLSDNTGHRRKTFLLGGEDWACCITSNTSNFYMGDSSQNCLRKGTFHVEDLENHGYGSFPGAAPDEHCGIMCETHARRLQKQWAVKLTKI